jgi:hypothetical protein
MLFVPDRNAEGRTSKCLTGAKTYTDFEECSEDCTGTPLPPFIICQKITTDGQLFDACDKKHRALQEREPAKYKCWTSCGRRANDSATAAACDATCGVP